MNKYIERFLGTKSSLQRKVIVIYLLVAVLPIIIITLFISAIYYNNILKAANTLLDQNAGQHEEVVHERMDEYENVLYELVTNKEYISLSKRINEGNEDTLIMDVGHMEDLLRSSVYTYDRIRSITFLGDSGRYASYSKWYSSNHENIWIDDRKREVIHDEVEKQQKLTFIATVNLREGGIKGDYVVLMGFPVKNLRTKEQSGVLVMALENDVLLFEGNEDKRKESGVATIILDREDRILAGTDPDFINLNYKEYVKEEFGKTKRISEMRHSIEGTEWTIMNIVDTDLYRKDIYDMVRAVVVLVLTITCNYFSTVFRISRKYVQTIQKIAQGIHNYEGTDAKQINVEMDEKNELYVIVRQFNTMTARVNSLVEKLKQKNEEIKAAAISQKHAEIKALEAQINPHFLFNTLDSINWRAIEHDEEEISNMLGVLGSLLRYSISNIDMEVVLEAEISWLKKYIFLQRDRFQYSFDCEYDITEEAMAFPIYKMLLQPIIENTILHAFEEVKEGGMIYVKAFKRQDGKLEIRIRDNGSGMKGEVLAEIRKEISENGPLNSKSIGISNVIHRLRLYYQEEAEITVNSTWGEGTEFVLVIPERQQVC